MKGVIFTEFLDFVEAQSGYEVVDSIIQAAALPSEGAYTAVGNYDYSELADLITAMSKTSHTALPVLLRSFGHYLFKRYTVIYPSFFDDYYDPLDFLETIEQRIHTEVLKLYPDARLPRLKTERVSRDELIMQYRSSRPLGDLCLGVIEGCGRHFHVTLETQSTPVPDGLDIIIVRGSFIPSEQLDAEVFQ